MKMWYVFLCFFNQEIDTQKKKKKENKNRNTNTCWQVIVVIWVFYQTQFQTSMSSTLYENTHQYKIDVNITVLTPQSNDSDGRTQEKD